MDRNYRRSKWRVEGREGGYRGLTSKGRERGWEGKEKMRDWK